MIKIANTKMERLMAMAADVFGCQCVNRKGDVVMLKTDYERLTEKKEEDKVMDMRMHKSLDLLNEAAAKINKANIYLTNDEYLNGDILKKCEHYEQYRHSLAEAIRWVNLAFLSCSTLILEEETVKPSIKEAY